MARRFQVISYDGVTKNDDDMWVVTKPKKENLFFEPSSDNFDTKEVLKFLKDSKITSTADQRKVNTMIGSDLIEVFEKKGRTPICRLVKSL